MGIQQLTLGGGAQATANNLQNASRNSLSPTDAYAGVRLHSDGTVDRTQATSLSWALDDGLWLLSGANSQFEMRFTLNSGTAPSGGLSSGTWYVLSTTREMYFANTDDAVQSLDCNITIDIGYVGTSTALSSKTITLHAEIQ